MACVGRFGGPKCSSNVVQTARSRPHTWNSSTPIIPFYGVDLVSLLNHQPPAFIAEADAVVAFKLNPPNLHGATSP
jgi:hypothetical protein